MSHGILFDRSDTTTIRRSKAVCFFFLFLDVCIFRGGEGRVGNFAMPFGMRSGVKRAEAGGEEDARRMKSDPGGGGAKERLSKERKREGAERYVRCRFIDCS